MRKVPELRFDGFDGEWEEKKINDLAEFYSGGTPTSNNRSYYNGSIPFIRSGEIHSNTTELYISEEGLSNSSAKMVNKGDLVYALYGATSGEADIIKMSGAINQAILAIILEDEYNPIFILNYLNKSKNYILSKYLQGGQGNLSGQIIRNIEIALPKSSEQEKIGDLFSKLDDLIEIQEGKVAKMEDLKKSMLQKMFPKKDELVPEFRFDGFDGEWKMDKLKNILNYRRGSFPQPYTEASWYGGEGSMPFVQVNDVENDSFKLKYPTNKTISTLAMPKSVFVEKGTILVTIQGSIGRIALTQYDSYVDRTLLIITDNIIEFDKYFLINVLYLLFYKEKFKASGGTIKSITTKKLGDFKISFPSIEEQEKIGNFFKNLDTQIEAEERLLDSYKMMKKSLLQKMFV